MNRDEYQEIYDEILDIGSEDYGSLSKEQRVIFNVTPLVDLGLMDYYQNSGADYNLDTLEDLLYLEAKDTFTMIQKVNSLFPGGQPPSDIDERCDILGDWDEDKCSVFDNVDSQFSDHAEGLEKKLLHFAQSRLP